jgi:very-short-patch-repair endonuclease
VPGRNFFGNHRRGHYVTGFKEESPLPLGEGQGEGAKHMKSLARALRRNATDAERLLWKHLRGRRLAGYKFRRQVVIESWIVDFVCLEAKLIIEADGGQHAEQVAQDARRTARLEAMGYRVMRFWNHEILMEHHSVLEQIQSALIEAPSPQPSPRGRGS